MNYKYILMAAALVALPAVAQETYENAKIADEDLNGTARYVGMGGAMEALGADLSTISSNPAGLGLMRHSQVAASASIVSQSGLPSGALGDKTHASFDQIGVVVNLTRGSRSNVNLAFNYHKSKNFDFILAGSNKLTNGSQNKLTYQKLRNGLIAFKDGYAYGSANQLDALYDGYLTGDDGTVLYQNASEYAINREHTGYIGNYEFNLSGNAGRQFYWGVTFGIKDVHYDHTSAYAEILTDNEGTIGVADRREITGTGFDIKAGLIVRPVAESPFRIGAYIHTPTFYSLTTTNRTVLGATGNVEGTVSNSESYEYKLYTPWKFGLSLGHTIGNCLALGATYEYADYGALNTRINDGYYSYNYDPYYDEYYDTYYDSSSPDRVMNDHTKNTLKGVSTLKLGLEYKPVQNLAIRLGYNYVSPKYKESGYKDVTLESNGTYYASQTDYTNWKATNRFTFGLGYTVKKFTIDLAYQLSTQKGTFYPFSDYYENGVSGAADANDCIGTPTEVKNNRNQFLLTLGYHF